MRLLTLTLLASLAAAPTLAADLGTYRPGTPYHSAIVPGPDVCESQCAGDARCRGWNYVKANPQAPGVCEFQAQIGAPISSAISISGVSATASPVSDRVVAGQTNTVRVGTSVPETVMVSTPSRPVVRSGERPQMQQQRRVMRQPVPAQGVPIQARHQQVIAPQQRLQPMLDGQMPQRAPIARAPQPPLMQAPRGPARQPQQARARAVSPTQLHPGQMGQPQARPMQTRPAYNGRPPIGQTIAPPADYRPPAPAAQPTSAMPRASASNPVTFETAAGGLYGSLHDDVRVPASNMPVPADPNAPIPTSQSRPVVPVTQSALAGPAR